MYDPLPERDADEHVVSLFGSDFALDESSDIRRLVDRYGYTLRELPACHTWEDYLKLSEGSVFLDIYPAGKYGMEMQARRLGREHLYLPGNLIMKRRQSSCSSFADTGASRADRG